MATFQLSSAASLNMGWSQNGVLGNGLTLYHIIRPQRRRLWKIMWDKEKMLVISIFSFSPSFLTYRREKSSSLTASNLLSANAFNLDQSEILSFGKELKAFADDNLNFTQRTKNLSFKG